MADVFAAVGELDSCVLRGERDIIGGIERFVGRGRAQDVVIGQDEASAVSCQVAVAFQRTQAMLDRPLPYHRPQPVIRRSIGRIVVVFEDAVLLLQDRRTKQDAPFVVAERRSRRIKQHQALMLDQRFGERVQQRLLVIVMLDPRRVLEERGFGRLALGVDCKLQVCGKCKTALAQHPAVGDQLGAEGGQVQRLGPHMAVILAPRRIAHHALDGVVTRGEESGASLDAGRNLGICQVIEGFPGKLNFHRVVAALGYQSERQARRVA
ncbi:hypothetical protein [Mesorhizobium sp.]|uniref:hypothetical protein n=1 Tax=Mesorhizobium sp. TaxID=1871066 RepID=UPI0025C17995|nr:hypothetical protein [Mesorhizobium sp.]